jgi:hypothetical protein
MLANTARRSGAPLLFTEMHRLDPRTRIHSPQLAIRCRSFVKNPEGFYGAIVSHLSANQYTAERSRFNPADRSKP